MLLYRTARVTRLTGFDKTTGKERDHWERPENGPMEIGQRRNSFWSRNKLYNIYLILTNVINS